MINLGCNKKESMKCELRPNKIKHGKGEEREKDKERLDLTRPGEENNVCEKERVRNI